MSSVLDAGEVNHAINASEGGAVAAVSMRIKLLLGEDVTTRLAGKGDHDGGNDSRVPMIGCRWRRRRFRAEEIAVFHGDGFSDFGESVTDSDAGDARTSSTDCQGSAEGVRSTIVIVDGGG